MIYCGFFGQFHAEKKEGSPSRVYLSSIEPTCTLNSNSMIRFLTDDD